MAIATCAVCGATADVSGNPGNWKIDPDYATVQPLCKNWPPPPESRRGFMGESPTGCPNLDQAAMMQMRPRPPRPIF